MFALVLIFGRSLLSKSLEKRALENPALVWPLNFPPGLGGGLLRVLGTGSALLPAAPPELMAAKVVPQHGARNVEVTPSLAEVPLVTDATGARCPQV